MLRRRQPRTDPSAHLSLTFGQFRRSCIQEHKQDQSTQRGKHGNQLGTHLGTSVRVLSASPSLSLHLLALLPLRSSFFFLLLCVHPKRYFSRLVRTSVVSRRFTLPYYPNHRLPPLLRTPKTTADLQLHRGAADKILLRLTTRRRPDKRCDAPSLPLGTIPPLRRSSCCCCYVIFSSFIVAPSLCGEGHACITSQFRPDSALWCVCV